MAVQAKIKNQDVHVGDTVRLDILIQEGKKTRTQAFEGVVISIKGRQAGKTFTIRKIASGNIGVEQIWPIASPLISKVEVLKKGMVRRSKLYYLRGRKGKQALKIRSIEKKATPVKKKKKASSAKKASRKTGRRPSTKASKK